MFGTSVFQKLSEEEQDKIVQDLKNHFTISFQIVSANEENEYTVEGIISNIDYNQKMAVVIGSGGSTEIAIVENKKIIKKINLDFSAMDITEQFEDLKEDISKTSFDDILSYTMEQVGELNESAPVLVLAGGDYIYFYETVGYEMKENNLYKDPNQPYLLDFKTLDDYDHDILSKSLEEIKNRCPDNKLWWDRARGMRFCINAVARKLNAEYIIPTRINMLIGIANAIKKLMENIKSIGSNFIMVDLSNLKTNYFVFRGGFALIVKFN